MCRPVCHTEGNLVSSSAFTELVELKDRAKALGDRPRFEVDDRFELAGEKIWQATQELNRALDAWPP